MTMFKPTNPPVSAGSNTAIVSSQANSPSPYQRLASEQGLEAPRNTSSPFQLPTIQRVASGSPFSHEEILNDRWKRSTDGTQIEETSLERRAFSNIEMGSSRQGSEARDGDGDNVQGHKRKPSAPRSAEVPYARRSVTAEEGVLTDPGSPHRRKRAKTEDEKEQRRLERLLSNRLAAEKSRERKRREFEVLKAEKEEIERSNQQLLSRIADLEARYQGAPSDREYFQVEEEAEPAQLLSVTKDPSRGDQERLTAAWQQLNEKTASLEEERQRFVDEKQAWRQEYELMNRSVGAEGSRTKDNATESRWNTEREELMRQLGRLTAELENSGKERERLAEEHKKREDEIHQSHHDHKMTLLAARDQHAVNLVNLLNQKDEELRQKEQHIQELEKLASLKSDALISAEAHSATRENLMKTLDALIISLESTVESKEAALSTLQRNLAASEAELRSMKEQFLRPHPIRESSARNENPQSQVFSAKTDILAPVSEHRSSDAAKSVRDEDIPSIRLPQPAEIPAQTISMKAASDDGSHNPQVSDSNTVGDEIIVSVKADNRSHQFKKPSSRRSRSLGRDLALDANNEPRRRTRSGNFALRQDRESPSQAVSEPKESRKLRERGRKGREAEDDYVEMKYDDGSKPAHSYTHLIGMAIVESPDRQLRLAEIYKWISDTYSFYSVDAPLRKDWKNAIRSTLSTNKKFIRQWRPGEDPAKGSYWGIQDGEDEEFIGRPIYIQAKASQRVGKTKNNTS